MRVAQSCRPAAFVCAATFLCAATVATAQQQNPVFENLVQVGVTLSDGTVVKLPQPIIPNGLNAAAQQKVMAGLVPAGRLANFQTGNLNDWFELKISGSPATAPGKVSARTVDLYYIANGPLEAVANKGFIKESMGDGGDNPHMFTDQELKDEEIEVAKDTDTKRERYAHAKLDLFNMAKVEGTGRGVFTKEQDNILVAFSLDQKFEGNKKFPNQWQVVTLNPAGGKVLGNPQPYKGVGGYLKVTRVAGVPRPQVFIEYHLVFEEPFEWFNGKPVLTSKLPDKVRADVRSFRRKLADFVRLNPALGAAAQANANAAAKSDDKAEKSKPVQAVAK